MNKTDATVVIYSFLQSVAQAMNTSPVQAAQLLQDAVRVVYYEWLPNGDLEAQSIFQRSVEEHGRDTLAVALRALFSPIPDIYVNNEE